MLSDYTIHILTHQGKQDIAEKTQQWWQNQGWKTVLYDNTGYLPAVGRNAIIKQWRDTDEDTLFMCDDDVTLYTHRYLTKDFLKNPPKQDVYTLNSNQQVHHQRLNSNGWDDGKHHWDITDQICKFYAINCKDIPLQDENLLALEDLDWAWQCANQGITPYRINTVFLREQSMHTRSLFGPQEQRKEIYAKATQQLKEKWHFDKKIEIQKQLGIKI